MPSFVSHHKQELPVINFAFLFKMEQKHFWHTGRKEIILDTLERDVPNLRKCKMLEVGCGNGNILAFLEQNGIDVEGGDISPEALKFCRKRTSARLHQVDVVNLPFHNSYDIIGLFDVLEHIEDDAKALQSIHKALKPKGKLLLTVPAYSLLWSSFDVVALHKRRYTKEAMCGKLEENGYRVLKASYFMSFLFPIIALIRLCKRSTADCSNMVEMKTIPVINEIFLPFLRLEKLLIGKFNLPFGSSIIVLAEKI